MGHEKIIGTTVQSIIKYVGIGQPSFCLRAMDQSVDTLLLGAAATIILI